MGLADWKAIYRAYTAEELATEMEELKKDLRGSYSAQASGGISHQREVRELRDRLRAATEVSQGEGKVTRRGVVDFGDVSGRDL